MVNTALENLVKISGNMTFGLLKYWIGTKFRAQKRLFRALGTIVLREFGHSLISHKIRGNSAADSHSLRRLRAPLPRPVCDMFELHEFAHHISQF